MNDDNDPFDTFVKWMGIYFLVCIITVPAGMLTGVLIKYFMGL